MKNTVPYLIVYLIFLSIGLNVYSSNPGVFIEAVAGQASHSYYFDSEKGYDNRKQCNIDHPFKTLSKANSLDLKPGDQLLFKRGGYWRGQLHPKGSGSSTSRIKVDCYGSKEDPLPLIEAAGAESAIMLENQENWVISNIAVSNLTSDQSVSHHGILIRGTDRGVLNNIRIESIRVNEIQGNGGSCGINVLADCKNIPTSFNNLVINNCFIKKVPFNGINLQGGEGVLPGGQGWEQMSEEQKKVKYEPSKNVIVSNNIVIESGWSGIFVYTADAPLLTHNLVAGCNWNKITSNGYGVGLWVWNSIDGIVEYNEVYDTKEPYNDGNNDRDGDAFDISRSLRCTVRYNICHDNNGGFMLIDNYSTPTVYKENIVHDNLSINDEIEFFQLMGNNTTRIYNNIFHTGKELDFKPSLFFCNASGQPSDVGNITEPSNDIMVFGNVFSSDAGGCKNNVFRPGNMNFERWIDTTKTLNGMLGGIDFGKDIWLRGYRDKATEKYMFLNKNEKHGSAPIDFSPRDIKLHSIDMAGTGTVILTSDNVANPPVNCRLDSARKPYQTFKTNWRFPAGIVTVTIDNPDGVSQTHFDNIIHYRDGYTFTGNYFINTPEPSDTVYPGQITSINNKIMTGDSELPLNLKNKLDSLKSNKFFAKNYEAKGLPSEEWINHNYKSGAEVVAYLDGEPIHAIELNLAMEELRPSVLDSLKLTSLNKNDELNLKERAINICCRRKMLQIIAKQQGLIMEADIFNVLWEMQNRNKRHEQQEILFFGPGTFCPDAYLEYYYRNIAIQLKKILKADLMPSKTEMENYEKENIAKGKKENTEGFVKIAVDQNFKKLVDLRLGQAKISKLSY